MVLLLKGWSPSLAEPQLLHIHGHHSAHLKGGDEIRRVRLPPTKIWCHFLKDVIPGLHFYYSPSLC